MRNVYLTGFMGTGKSAVGRALAKRLGRRFVDLDAQIERTAGLKVSEIFARRGEKAFRRMERIALARFARRRGLIVALGGGALHDPRSRALAARTGDVVLLTCSRRELARRLRPQREGRPLLAGGPLDARIARLLAARRTAAAPAAVVVSTTRLSPAAAAALVARRLP